MLHVNSFLFQPESCPLSTVSTRRKSAALYASHLMRLRMYGVMDNNVNTGFRYFVVRLVNRFTHFCAASALILPPRAPAFNVNNAIRSISVTVPGLWNVQLPETRVDIEIWRVVLSGC